MEIGTQLYAPLGYGGSMSADQTFYLLKSTADPHRVLLVFFSFDSGVNSKHAERKADLLALPRKDFESAIVSGAIVARPLQRRTPPWLSLLGDDPLAALKAVKAAVRHIDRWFTIIEAAVTDFETIVRERDVVAAINSHARAQKQNTTRFRTKLLSFLLFGRSRWVLAPTYHLCGRYDRDSVESTIKVGRPHKTKGARFGSRLVRAVKDLLIAGYHKHKGLGIRLIDIYRRVLRESLGCLSRKIKTEHGFRYEYFQPENGPVPSLRQFHYLIYKEIGRKTVRIDRFGPELERHRQQFDIGSFAEHLSNLYEKVEIDAYQLKRRGRDPFGNELPPIWVVRLICVTSGALVGIGFSMRGEKAEAYRCALFCAAICKVTYCRMFGLEIEADEWPCIGLAPHLISDQGAGAAVGIKNAPLRGLTQPYDGRAKGTIESSNPRPDKLEGAPSYLVSEKSAVQLCAEEITRTLTQNHTKFRRRTPRMAVEGIPPTPIGVWKYLADLGRNDAITMDFNEAVREFLPQRPVIVSGAGVTFKSQLYRPTERTDLGLLNRPQNSEMSAHILPMSLPTIWLNGGDSLLELGAYLRFADGDMQLRLSEEELEAIEESDRQAERELREQIPATAAYFEDRHFQSTGVAVSSGTRKRGRPKVRRSADAATREYAEALGAS